jgi:hypothetical protein
VRIVREWATPEVGEVEEVLLENRFACCRIVLQSQREDKSSSGLWVAVGVSFQDSVNESLSRWVLTGVIVPSTRRELWDEFESVKVQGR